MHSRKRHALFAAVTVAGVIALAGAAAQEAAHPAAPPATPAATQPAAPAYTLEDLRWIVGDWRGTFGEDSIVEESWREPIGDAMLGTFRWVTNDKTRFYEIIVIEQDPSGPVMRLKHFNPGLKGWEEKDECLAWPLLEARDGRAVFRRGKGEHTGDIVLERRGDAGLYISVDVVRNGSKDLLEFNFTRHQP